MPPRWRYNGPLGEIKTILSFRADIVSLSGVIATYSPRLSPVQAQWLENLVVNFDAPTIFSMHLLLIFSCPSFAGGLLSPYAAPSSSPPKMAGRHSLVPCEKSWTVI